MNFKDLNLHPKILQAIEEQGYSTPTPIQWEAIPKVLAGNDICASAQTGTGKTASFILPALNRLTVPSPIKATGPRILILVPTRELAMQVAAEAIKCSRHLSKVKTVCIYGGAPYPTQNRELSRPYEILVATPGRLIDHMERGRISFDRLEMFILDEADRMLDMGFIQPVEQIAEATPSNRQTLLFSATMGGNVLKLSQKLLTKPVEIRITPEKARHDNIEQRLHYMNNINDKHKGLDYLLDDVTINQAIIFTSTKRQADHLTHSLLERGYHTAALHGDMNQRQRTRTIHRLRKGEIRILVATDVAARGIDVQTITHVINFDLPTNVEDYVHRIGRTGRAQAKGVAMSFATPKELFFVKEIEKYTGQKIALHPIPGIDVQLQSLDTKPKSTKPKRPLFKPKSSFSKSPRQRREGMGNRDGMGNREKRSQRFFSERSK